jgi:hypothetical protein
MLPAHLQLMSVEELKSTCVGSSTGSGGEIVNFDGELFELRDAAVELGHKCTESRGIHQSLSAVTVKIKENRMKNRSKSSNLDPNSLSIQRQTRKDIQKRPQPIIPRHISILVRHIAEHRLDESRMVHLER